MIRRVQKGVQSSLIAATNNILVNKFQGFRHCSVFITYAVISTSYNDYSLYNIIINHGVPYFPAFNTATIAFTRYFRGRFSNWFRNLVHFSPVMLVGFDCPV